MCCACKSLWLNWHANRYGLIGIQSEWECVFINCCMQALGIVLLNVGVDTPANAAYGCVDHKEVRLPKQGEVGDTMGKKKRKSGPQQAADDTYSTVFTVTQAVLGNH